MLYNTTAPPKKLEALLPSYLLNTLLCRGDIDTIQAKAHQIGPGSTVDIPYHSFMLIHPLWVLICRLSPTCFRWISPSFPICMLHRNIYLP